MMAVIKIEATVIITVAVVVAVITMDVERVSVCMSRQGEVCREL